jgi:hypothetical protein
MATERSQKMNALFEKIFRNGVGEAGLEVGSDPGLPADEYIRIPRSLNKLWYVRLTRAEFDEMKEEAADETPARDLGDYVEEYPGSVEGCRGLGGWVTGGTLVVHEGKFQWKEDSDSDGRDVEEFHINPPTDGDLKDFITVNMGHIRDNDFTTATQMWIHACRFWAVVAGFVTSTKNKEYILVDKPTEHAAGIDDMADFISEYSANAWTASAARATSWRKTNHATGGQIVQGFPRSWLNKMGYIEQQTDDARRLAHMREVTSAFYIATHASSVHATLALQAPGDTAHWAEIDPSFGLIPKWEIGTSAKIRMEPKTQVAGVSIVTDSVIVLRMMIKEALAPLLNNINQAEALFAAFETVRTEGIRCASYAKWFLDGHPEDLDAIDFGQKDPSYADLAGELATVATRYYHDTTIGKSQALANAASQLGASETAVTWSTLAAKKKQISSVQIVKAVTAIKGAGTATTVTKLLSGNNDEIDEGVTEYNRQLARLATMASVTAPPVIDGDFIKGAKATEPLV